MTIREFKETLASEGHRYKTTLGGNILVVDKRAVNLQNLTSMPSGVKFVNDGNVYLDRLLKIPKDVIFNNKGDVYLQLVKNIDPSVKFNNNQLFSVFLADDWISTRNWNIQRVDSKRLLNLMISKGLFI